MPSNCIQVRDFVVFSKQLHGKLKELYVELNEHAQSEQVTILLDLLSRHEEHIVESLANFEKESQHGILEAWLEYSDLDVNKVMCKIHFYENPTCDEIMKIARDFSDTLFNFYKEISEKVDDFKVKAVFKNLLEFEVQENKNIDRELMYLSK